MGVVKQLRGIVCLPAWQQIVALVGLAVLLRVGIVMAFPNHPVTGLNLNSNAKRYYLPIARNLTAGRAYNTPESATLSKIAPAYPYFMSAVFHLFGESLTALRVAQCILDALTVGLLFGVARLVFGKRTACLAGLAACFYPFSIYFCFSVSTETLFTFLLIAFALVTVKALQTDDWLVFAGAGVLLGLTTLTRATTQLFPLVLVATVLWVKGFEWQRVARCGVLVAAFVLVILPWTVRNYLALGDFIPVSTGTGSVLLQGSDERFFTIDGKSQHYAGFHERARRRGIKRPDNAKESEIDRYITRVGIERYVIRFEERPLSIIPFMAKKFLRLWYATEEGWHQGKILAVNGLIVPFALLGVVFSRRRERHGAWAFVVALLAYFVLIHWLLLPLARYMVPVTPLLIMFGAYGLCVLSETAGRRLCRAANSTLPRAGGSAGTADAEVEGSHIVEEI